MPPDSKSDARRPLRQWGRSTAATVSATLVVLGLAGAFCDLGAGSATADPAPGPATPDQVALETLDDIVQGDDVSVTERFDDTMKSQLSAETLGQARTSYQQQFGAYQSHGVPQDITRGDITVVNIPLQMQQEPGQFRLSLHPDGTVAGLFFLRQGIPVP